MMTQVDEIDKDKHINMVFVEFLDAVVRVADKAEIPHCVLDEFTWGADEIEAEMKKANLARRMYLLEAHKALKHRPYARVFKNFIFLGIFPSR